ncbi:hypothetical protein [Rhodococcus rhodnii]|uniref:Uncharacterized protein n=1 Tax=Rhodococcus rhodnii LMG 5362 TaxID=1273125 RepID=R7WGQ5_9NOCA|nr:hypothetical protein [Rhodococcus rhodnii]EOM74265.1 hypothetical protein Rrhod_4409 [Rhodococcus rhodnii LMG 5362]
MSFETVALPPDRMGNPDYERWARVLGDRWDLVLAVSELPAHVGPRPVLAECASDTIAALFVPATGALRVGHRSARVAEAAIARMIGPDDDDTAAPLARTRWVEEENGRCRLMGSAALGRARLVAGMVRANRPWRLVPTLTPAFGAASAASAFGIFYSSIWLMAASISVWRLATIVLTALVAMCAWLILPNRLLERRGFRTDRSERSLYNTATLATVVVGVLCMSVLLAVAVAAVAAIVISPDFLGDTLGREATIVDYARLVALSTALGIVAGAVGTSAADHDEILRATYGQREYERRMRDADSGS